MYRNPLVTVAVTASLVPASTSDTTEDSSVGSLRTFKLVMAYFSSITLSARGVIVSETVTLGFGSAILTAVRLVRRLSCCSRAVVSAGVDSSDVVEAGAGYATCGASPGMTAAATPTPKAVITTVGTAIRPARTARDGRIALLGRGLDTCSASPETNETKALSSGQESKHFPHDCPPLYRVWTRKYFFRDPDLRSFRYLRLRVLCPEPVEGHAPRSHPACLPRHPSD